MPKLGQGHMGKMSDSEFKASTFRSIRARLGLSMDALAKEMGYKRASSIQHFETPVFYERKKGYIDNYILERLMDVVKSRGRTDISENEVFSLGSSIEKRPEGENALQPKVVPLQRQPIPTGRGSPDLIPIYGYVAGSNNMVAINESHIVGERERPYTLYGVKNAFLLIVIGDSMEPRYFQNELVHVNPSLIVEKGKDCVVELLDGSAEVKRYESQDDKILTCRQYNPEKTVKYKKKDVKAVYAIVGRG